MDGFEVENNHPIPAQALPRGRKEKYPWSKMEVGDSFFVEAGSIKTIVSAAAKAKGRTGFVFVARPDGEGIRVWRYA